MNLTTGELLTLGTMVLGFAGQTALIGYWMGGVKQAVRDHGRRLGVLEKQWERAVERRAQPNSEG